MAVTLSHQSALDVMRQLRAEGVNVWELDAMPLKAPSTWVGTYWTKREFAQDQWRWDVPTSKAPLHVLVPKGNKQIRAAHICAHVAWGELPQGSVLWLDEHSSIVCPELLFLQMATVFSLPSLVLLGYELCGHFSRSALDPRDGVVTDNLPAVTSVEKLRSYLGACYRMRGAKRAKRALELIADHAISAPESVLATVYSLSEEDLGYGMGPVVLNKRVGVASHYDESAADTRAKTRFPDLMFTFAPVGINYDGAGHLDLRGLIEVAQREALAKEEERSAIHEELLSKCEEVRAKVVDDNQRNRQLLAKGNVILVAYKEDLYGRDNLDRFTQQLLDCAQELCGADVERFRRAFDDTDRARDRYELLKSMLPQGASGAPSYGKM